MAFPTRRPNPVLTGIVGVVVAHIASSLLVYRSPAQRAAAMLESGHAYWHHAVALAVAAGVLTFGRAVGRGVRRAVQSPLPAEPAFVRRLIQLATCQLALFGVLEIVERSLADHALAALARDPSFLLGLVLQVVVAALFLVVLDGVERVSEAVARRHRRTSWPQRRPSSPLTLSLPLRSRSLFPVEPRGPPLAVG